MNEYCMILHPVTFTILGVRHDSSWPEPIPISGGSLVSATFSSNTGSGADVITPAGKPEVGATYNPTGHVYTLPDTTTYKLKEFWSGSGQPSGMWWEINADGVNEVTMTVKKWNVATDQEVGSGSEEFYVYITGAPVEANVGKIQLVNGEASITLKPAANCKGYARVDLVPTDMGNLRMMMPGMLVAI